MPIDDLTVQLTVARDLLSHDAIRHAEMAVRVAVLALEHSGERPDLAAELGTWVEDFAPYGLDDYEHPAYEPTKQAEGLLAELDDIAERHDVRIDTGSSTGYLQPATLPADLMLERRMNRLQVGQHITLPNGSQLVRGEHTYVVDDVSIGDDPPIAARAALDRDARAVKMPPARVSAPDARHAHDVAALCQAYPPRDAAAGPAGAGPGAPPARTPTAVHADRGAGR